MSDAAEHAGSGVDGRYDAGNGYGFLVPEDGAADIFCHASVLQEVGLARLVEGATVSCEVAPGRHGPQVLRILGVDFRPALPAPLSAGAATGGGRGRTCPGSSASIRPPGRLQRRSGGPARRLSARARPRPRRPARRCRGR